MNIHDTYIFKYCSYDIAEVIVSGQLLKFSRPDSFNDPFDCDIELLQFDFSEANQEIIDDLNKIKKNISEQWGRDMSTEIDKISRSKIEDTYKRSQLDKIRRSSICCFSKDSTNTTMWSHYADNHRGACLIFDLENKKPFIDYPSHRFTQGPVDYDNYTSINYLKSEVEGIVKVFLTKSPDWKYEKEYRFIIFEEHGLFKFSKEFLRGIIFGLRVSDEEILRFKNICQRQGYKDIEFGRFKKEELKLKLEDI
ncbi:MAG: DUF2971 domain-containing protein [Bacteroidetes bacterium]|nr:DUF2971 domain-containing protein [Bacteroidota bacterium]